MSWNESLNIELPKYWIEPAEVTSLLPPYYGRIVREYVEWMQHPHSSLKGLSWGDDLDFIYRPLDPSIKEREEKNPTTYFVYEGIYTLFAGLVTENIQPKNELDPAIAGYLRRQLIVNLAEVMHEVSQLGLRRISFDQEHNPQNRTYRLLEPLLRNRGRYPEIKAVVGRDYSLAGFSFISETRSFAIGYDDLYSLRFFPAEINGERASFVTQCRLDRARPYPDERRLMFDFEVKKLLWDRRCDEKYLPKTGADVSLTDQFFGESRHHINLAILIGNSPGQYDIDLITKAVVTELGLSRLLTQSFAYNKCFRDSIIF